MNRVESFIAGLVLGIAGLYGAMHYSIVRAQDGIHFIPKISARLEPPYVDIRDFTLDQWQKKQTLALSILKSKKGYLLEDHTLSGFKFAAQQLLEQSTLVSRTKTTSL